MLQNSEIRSFVKEKIKGNAARIFGVSLLSSLLMLIITQLLGMVFAFVNSELLEWILSAAITGCSAPLTVGLYKYVINITTGQEAHAGMLFDYYKYFGKIFVVGLVGTLAFSIGFMLLIIPGLIIYIIYMGMLYMIAMNPTLSLGELYNKVITALKGYKSQGIFLTLSYAWQYLVAGVVYIVLAIITLGTTVIEAISNNLTDAEALTSILGSTIAFVGISLLFGIICIVLSVYLTPRLMMAQTKFYLLLLNPKTEKSKEITATTEEKKEELTTEEDASTSKFCPNCGNPVVGNFCTNCGNKM